MWCYCWSGTSSVAQASLEPSDNNLCYQIMNSQCAVFRQVRYRRRQHHCSVTWIKLDGQCKQADHQKEAPTFCQEWQWGWTVLDLELDSLSGHGFTLLSMCAVATLIAGLTEWVFWQVQNLNKATILRNRTARHGGTHINPCTLWAEEGTSLWIWAILVYIVTSKTARALWRNPVSEGRRKGVDI